MPAKYLKALHYLVPLAVLVAAIVLRWQDVPMVGQLRATLFDTYQQIAPREFEDVGVRILDIDEKSLAELGQWPWPRTRMAELVYRLRAGGAAIVGFDIVFAEADRTSPMRVVESWPQNDDMQTIRDLAATLPDHDDLFAQFIGGVGNIVTVAQLTRDTADRAPAQIGNFSVGGEAGRQLFDFIPVLPGANSSLSQLENAAAGNGLVNVAPGGDGVVRRVPLMLALDMELPVIGKPVYPTLSMEMLRVLQQAPRTMNVRMSGSGGKVRWTSTEGIDAIRVGAITIPTDQNGYMWVHYTGHKPERYISASDVLHDRVGPDELANTAILIGTSAAGLLDLRSSPLNPILPGVEIHAEMLEQMLLEHFLTRPYWSAEAETLALLIAGLMLVFAIPRLGAVWPAIFGVVLIGGAIYVSWWAYQTHLMLIDPAYATITLMAVYVIGSFIGFMRTEGEKRQVRTAFASYLSPALVEQLAQHPERLKLGGETRDMTLLFCDVRGFTTISETFKSDPQGLTRLINRLLTPLTDCILARQGTIDKYMGDCIMAFWNAPLDVPAHPVNACDSALAMFKALDVLNAERKAEAEAEGVPFLPLMIGAGINSGPCVVGNMGSDQRFDYSVLGDAVNLAARLEGQSKSYGVDIVLGPDTAAAAQDRFAIVQLDLIAVKGKTEAVRIFALLGDDTLRTDPTFIALSQNHEAMLAAYRSQNWDQAEHLIATCRSADIDSLETLYGLYEDRIASFRATPPGPDWDGVYVATSK
ncbi:CHASE2 domain-containing protein [Thalassospira sp.]|uniref:CHASE2 domain-containing protein n=1 Tax=Thalassospira sp. TaxID=1912094 RepID=UPI0027371C13|nr:adenylate/guanylate cyclase domain-containing protein [Thalassospira sp.]MDP2699679.1 adenylate/guanylate cyclase domain-containing protein [Thalassospira sp.]